MGDMYMQTKSRYQTARRILLFWTLFIGVGAAAGVALAYYLTSVGNFALLTPIAMVLYQVLWLLPTLLLAGLVKHY